MNEIYEQLYNAGCIKFGEFRLKSGAITPIYVDLRVLISSPKLLGSIGERLAWKLQGMDYDRIAGLPYAALPIATAASLAGDIPLIYPRKEAKNYGTAKQIEGRFEPGDRVVVIDDVITDGGAKLELIKPLEDAGLIIKDVLIVLDREQGGKKILADAGYTLHSLTTISEALDALVAAGKITATVRSETQDYISTNQFV